MAMKLTRREGWIVAGVGIALVFAMSFRFFRREHEVVAPTAPIVEVNPAIVDWCAQGLEAIPGGACFHPAAGAGAAKGVLLYFHGLYPENAPGEELDRQRRLAERASARGYAVVAFRGRVGQCSAVEYADRFCWPSNERNADESDAYVASWKPSLDIVASRVGPLPRYVLGFSNGAYFSMILASRALVEAKAFAVAHGGPVQPVKARGPHPPILLIDADDDPSQPEMLRLDDALNHDGWPHDIVEREGGHALTDFDIDSALTFFARTRNEKPPLDPPIGRRTPRPHPDAGVDPDGAALDGETPEVDETPIVDASTPTATPNTEAPAQRTLPSGNDDAAAEVPAGPDDASN